MKRKILALALAASLLCLTACSGQTSTQEGNGTAAPVASSADPVTEDTRFHYGLDFAAPEGAPVYAFADGEVLVSGSSETAGNYLVLSHGEGWVSQYFHCSELYCKAGDRVSRGDVIAAVGQTGIATGPNLHFELMKDGAYVDPAPCLP